MGELPRPTVRRPAGRRWAIPLVLAARSSRRPASTNACVRQANRAPAQARTRRHRRRRCHAGAGVRAVAAAARRRRTPPARRCPTPLATPSPRRARRRAGRRRTAVRRRTAPPAAGSATRARAGQRSRCRARAGRTAAAPGEQPLVLAFRDYSWTEVRDRDGRVLLSPDESGRHDADRVGHAAVRVVIGNAADVDAALQGRAGRPRAATRGRTSRGSRCNDLHAGESDEPTEHHRAPRTRQVDVGGVRDRRRRADRRAVDDQHRHRRRRGDGRAGRARSPTPAPSSCASRSTRPRPRPRCPRSASGSTRRAARVPLIGDFHFNGHKLLTEYPDCARALAKYRINPGNVGKGSKRDPQFAVMIEKAHRVRQAGAHRRQLGQPRRRPARADDGRERAARRAAARRRGDARGARRLGDRQRAARRGARPARRPHRPVVQGLATCRT